jgi:acyl-CoA dehydrogenase
MVLARIEGASEGIKGVSLFLLPRTLEDGSANAYRIIRLKDKMGTRSMASGEIRLEGARAWLVGEAGRGFVHMADMVNNSRLSNGVRAAGLMRRALSEASFIARERRAFGKRLVDMPLMRRQLLKLTLPTEQARTMVFQTAEALRRSDAGESGAYRLVRILTPLIKFRACRDARKVTGDAMEVRGGCGYIEDWSDPRLVRDAHLGSIWEGTSNIVALDVLRAIRREASLPALESHLQLLLRETPMHAGARGVFERTLERAVARAAQAAEAGAEGDVLARQVATGLYNVTTAIAMAWEAGRTGSGRRMRVAQLVLRQRVLPQNPLGGDDTEPSWLPALTEHAAAADESVESINLF